MTCLRYWFGIAVAVALGGCATQRYGREITLSAVERQEFSCREIRIGLAKSQEFLASVRRQRAGLNGAQVLAIINDFGIGNVMEGEEAEASGRVRQTELQQLAAQKSCPA